MNKTINQLPNGDFEIQNESDLQKQFHVIQDHLNALNVKGALMSKGVSREILDRIIPEYEKRIHSIIYPLIID